MDLITTENLKRLSIGDLQTLIHFDNHGLLMGPNESLKDYGNRLGHLKNNFSEFNQELENDGEIELVNTKFKNSDKIPPNVFQTAEPVTRELYDFAIDWVPGFFTNAKMGLLFAGCAMYSFEDFFAVFIIRKAFKRKKRWIIYSRSELMAHELCHIAHIGFHTKNFEEILAYQTSESRFRKLLGGMLRTTTDTYLLLVAVILLLFSQMANVIFRPPAQWQDFPMPLIYGISFVTVAFVFVRYLFYWNQFRRARKNLTLAFKNNTAMPILFRCSGPEIKELSRLRDPNELLLWANEKQQNALRWKIIMAKYGPSK